MKVISGKRGSSHRTETLIDVEVTSGKRGSSHRTETHVASQRRRKRKLTTQNLITAVPEEPEQRGEDLHYVDVEGESSVDVLFRGQLVLAPTKNHLRVIHQVPTHQALVKGPPPFLRKSSVPGESQQCNEYLNNIDVKREGTEDVLLGGQFVLTPSDQHLSVIHQIHGEEQSNAS